MTKSDQIEQVLTRGVAQVLPNKDGLAQLMTQKKIKLYLGIDPTGSLLHLGHGVVLRKLQQFAELGHEVILLVGNGTVKIGDPTGKDESRPMLTDQEIEQNFQNWKSQASRILDFDQIEIRYNGDWLEDLNYSQIIKLMANVTVQQLMERDMFQERLKEGRPIHGHEIIYPLIQGYDSVAMNVDLEIGGTDQTFNMMMGRTLQKTYNNHEKWVLTTPLIEGTDGRKMSKSYHNYVALTEEPKEMFGKLMSIQDELIVTYFTVLTDLPLPEVKEIEQAIASGANPMEFKKKLALTITANLHDLEAAREAEAHFEQTVQQGELPENMPTITLDSKTVQVLELLNSCQPDQSNSHLRRLIEQGGVRLMPEDKKLTDPYAEIEIKSGQVIRIGKRDFYQLQVACP
ncbi:MAG: tyrosine--tRNA ligase [Candidatus Pacebacteria bacterium]|nr:tyrosine--tRNA ligase [Candidatus Paceibacterota bacterium]